MQPTPLPFTSSTSPLRPPRAGARAVPRVAAIVPAYNEGATLAAVVSVLQACQRVDEVLVVSDGSTDDTVSIARRMGALTLSLERNRGKAAAMAAGVAATRAPVLLFVDGDILQLQEEMIDRLLEPVLTRKAGMSVGTRSRGSWINAIHRRTGPLLSGVRCLDRRIFEAVPERFVDGFCIETALNWACRELRRPIDTAVLHGLAHRVKEQKQGFWRGLGARARMFGTVFSAYLRLHLENPPLRSSPIDLDLNLDFDLGQAER